MKAVQLVAARGLLRWTQSDLATASGVSSATIRRLEAMNGDLVANLATLGSLERALADAGVIFIPENGDGAGVRLRKARP